jgi:hypothetical protein
MGEDLMAPRVTWVLVTQDEKNELTRTSLLPAADADIRVIEVDSKVSEDSNGDVFIKYRLVADAPQPA